MMVLMETVAENGTQEYSSVSNMLSLDIEYRRADMGRDVTTCLVMLNSPVRTGTERRPFSLFSRPQEGLATTTI